MPHFFPPLLTRLLPLLVTLPTVAMAALPTNTEVEAILNKNLIASNQAMGADVALVDANGIRVVTAGLARDSQAVKPQDLFEIGSVTKTFTGLLLAIADEKK